MQEERLLRIQEVLRMVGVGKSTWWKWIGEGKAPRPVKISPRITVWRLSDVQAWIEERCKEAGDEA